VVRYLGCIKDRLIEHPLADYRDQFWTGARREFEQVAMSDADRERCEAVLALKVPPLTEAEKKVIRERQALAFALLRG
jgi:DNA-directed RNA polymerase sigma subunit (sigma70/sigma32)